MLTGQTIYGGDLDYMLSGLNRINIKRVLVRYTPMNVVPDQAFVDQIRSEQFGEGYVVEIKTGELSYLIKIKNDRYDTLHLTKDSINSNKRLFEAVIDEVTDDLRAMFSDDQHALDRIDKMERDVQPIFNHIVGTVESFVDHNKELDRKSFAIKAKAECSSLMGLVMNMYLGHDNDYKTFAKKYRKEMFGVKDDVVGDTDE
jgi:T4 RnlA family RNA ligase